MTLLDRVPTGSTRPSAAPRNLTPLNPLGGSYVTVSSTRPGHRRTEGTYVTTRSGAPAARGSYVSTVSPARPCGGFYTFSG